MKTIIVRVDTYFNCSDINLTDADLAHSFGLNPIQIFLLKTGQQVVIDDCTLERIFED